MRTAVKTFGPSDHGRRVTDEEAYAARYQEGFQYEIIDGRIYVSPTANPEQDRLNEWILDRLKEYCREHPDVINYVTGKGRVLVRLCAGAPCSDGAHGMTEVRARTIGELFRAVAVVETADGTARGTLRLTPPVR